MVSAAACGANAALRAVGLESAALDFFGHPPKHILADAYYSQMPLRYGAYIAKIGVTPVSPSLKALEDVKLDVSGAHSALRDAVVAFFRDHAAEYELCVQLCTDLERMPLAPGMASPATGRSARSCAPACGPTRCRPASATR